jgi:hypothetical protein
MADVLTLHDLESIASTAVSEAASDTESSSPQVKNIPRKPPTTTPAKTSAKPTQRPKSAGVIGHAKRFSYPTPQPAPAQKKPAKSLFRTITDAEKSRIENSMRADSGHPNPSAGRYTMSGRNSPIFPDQPDLPSSAFHLFVLDQKARARTSAAGARITWKLSEAWVTMPEQDRQPWQDKSSERRESWKQEMTMYRRSLDEMR